MVACRHCEHIYTLPSVVAARKRPQQYLSSDLHHEAASIERPLLQYGCCFKPYSMLSVVDQIDVADAVSKV